MCESNGQGGFAWTCATCGTQYAATPDPPAQCPVCCDDRQYVGWGGQRWLPPRELASRHRIRFAEEAGIEFMVIEPDFAIGQRALLIPDRGGLLMWECLGLVTDQAVERLAALGGITGIAVSHPHFYGAMAQWSEALGGVPVYLHAADREWVRLPPREVRFWEGSRLALSDEVELVHLPGHFPGSAGLWWKNGPRPGGSLFSGDAIQVASDRRFATFMYSYPNHIPLGRNALNRLEQHVAPVMFEDLFGFAPGRQIIGDAKARVDASFARYRAALAT